MFTTPQLPSASIQQESVPEDIKPEIDSSQPLTNLQIRLLDGTRLTAQFNTTSTISDLYNFITISRPMLTDQFVLQTTFPTKVLERGSRSIEQEGLKNGTVILRRIS